MIRHTVVFRLKAPKHSSEEREFLRAAGELAAIPGVGNFVCLRQVNPKSPFDYCLSMEFASQEDYQGYNRHPAHTQFVSGRWNPEVTAYMELDYELMHS
jgi:Stress responsive A/B Barrel Domain